jgi:hypothetical protein
MKRARTWWTGVAVMILAAVVPCSVVGQESDLAVAAWALMESAGNGKTAEAFKADRVYREAGLSFQEELLAPREGVIDCKDRTHQLAVLSGIYMADVGYATAFGKKDLALAIDQVARKDLMERMTVRPKLAIQNVDPTVNLRLLEGDPTSQANWDAVYSQVQADMDRMIKAAGKDPEMLAYVIDRIFGGALECIYLSSKLGLGSSGGEKLIPVFAAATARIDLLLPVLNVLKTPEMKASVQSAERARLLGSVKDIIQKKGGKLSADDLGAILKLVEPIRSSYIAKCK